MTVQTPYYFTRLYNPLYRVIFSCSPLQQGTRLLEHIFSSSLLLAWLSHFSGTQWQWQLSRGTCRRWVRHCLASKEWQTRGGFPSVRWIQCSRPKVFVFPGRGVPHNSNELSVSDGFKSVYKFPYSCFCLKKKSELEFFSDVNWKFKKINNYKYTYIISRKILLLFL